MHPGHRCIKGVGGGESSGSWLRYQGTYWVVGLSVCGPLISSSAMHLIDNFCYFFCLFPRLLYFLSYKIVADLIKTLFRRPEVANERSNNDLILLPTFRLSRANFHRPISVSVHMQRAHWKSRQERLEMIQLIKPILFNLHHVNISCSKMLMNY